MASSWSTLPTMTIRRPFVTTKFQSFANNSNMNQHIIMRFSAFVHQVSALIWPKRVHWLQQMFSHLAVNQTRIKISFWKFQHLFIMCLCKFGKKISAITQTACQLRPILGETLDASSNRICWDILKRKKLVRF